MQQKYVFKFHVSSQNSEIRMGLPNEAQDQPAASCRISVASDRLAFV